MNTKHDQLIIDLHRAIGSVASTHSVEAISAALLLIVADAIAQVYRTQLSDAEMISVTAQFMDTVETICEKNTQQEVSCNNPRLN